MDAAVGHGRECREGRLMEGGFILRSGSPCGRIVGPSKDAASSLKLCSRIALGSSELGQSKISYMEKADGAPKPSTQPMGFNPTVMKYHSHISRPALLS